MPETILDVAGQADASQSSAGNATPAQGTQPDDKFYDWATGQVKKEFLIDDLKGKPTITDFVKHYQGVKSELDTVKASVKDYIKIPGDKSTPEEIAAYNKAIGIPETADKYDLKVPEGVRVDEKAIAEFKKIAHEMGIPPKQAQALLDFDIKRQVELSKAIQEADKKAAEEGIKTLKEKHGDKFNEKLVHALRIVRKIGGENLEKELNEHQGNNAELIHFLMEVSQSFTEDGIVKGASASSGGDLYDLYPTMKGKF